MTRGLSALILFLCMIAGSLAFVAQTPKYPDYPSETPDTVKRATSGFDYEKRDIMIAIARRRETPHRHSYTQRRQKRPDTAHAHSIQCVRLNKQYEQLASWPKSLWV